MIKAQRLSLEVGTKHLDFLTPRIVSSMLYKLNQFSYTTEIVNILKCYIQLECCLSQMFGKNIHQKLSQPVQWLSNMHLQPAGEGEPPGCIWWSVPKKPAVPQLQPDPQRIIATLFTWIRNTELLVTCFVFLQCWFRRDTYTLPSLFIKVYLIRNNKNTVLIFFFHCQKIEVGTIFRKKAVGVLC